MSHSRREFLTRLGGGLALAPFAPSTPPAPTNLHIVTSGSSGGKPLLQPTDLSYLGVLQFPADGTFSGSTSIALRRAGGVTTLFATGRGGVFELSIPSPNGQTYQQLQSAPQLSPLRVWTNYTGSLVQTQEGNPVLGQIWWDEQNQQLWWTYVDGYSEYWNPSLGFCTLDNPTTGATTAYGPWRCANHSQQVWGYFLTIPSAFAAANCPGALFALGAPFNSGIAASSGPGAFATVPPTKRTPPDAISAASGPHVSVSQKTLMYFSPATPHPRPTDPNALAVKECGWRYASAGGSCPAGPGDLQGLLGITANFGPVAVDGSSVTLDNFSAACWIDTPSKQGVIYFGNIVAHVPGYTDYGGYGSDPGNCHFWYEDCGVCPHGQNGDYAQANGIWTATGPGATTMPPYFAIYDSGDLAKVAKGQLGPAAIRPTTFAPCSTIMSAWPKALGNARGWGGASFDPVSGLLYVLQRNAYFNDALNNFQSAVHVFQVRS